jgi:hypothetical protein
MRPRAWLSDLEEEMLRLDRWWARGLAAGFVAATSLVVWFLAIDLVAGAPLRTPGFMASALFGQDPASVGGGLIGTYTILHYIVFLAIGLASAQVAARFEARAYFLLGLVLGFLLFDVVFYASVLITGVNVVEALGWPTVLAGNVIAGIILLETLRLTSPTAGPGWRQFFLEHRILREGLAGGLLGAGAVALSFLVIDSVFREPLFTPAALGSALLGGAAGPEEIEITAATVLGYTVLHIVAFIGIGLAAAAMISEAERHPELLLGFVLVFVTFEALFIGLVAIVAAWILDTLGWWNVAIGNVIAAVLMVGYLAREHPALARRLGKESLEVPV